MATANGAEEKPKMQYKNLGSSGLKVSKVIAGCMSYGDPEWQGWVLPEEESLPLLKVRSLSRLSLLGREGFADRFIFSMHMIAVSTRGTYVSSI